MATASIRVCSTWRSEARIVIERSNVTTRSIFGSIELLSTGSSALTRVDHLDDVGAGLLENRDEHRGLAVVQAVGADVLGGAVLHVQHRRDVAEPHRRAIAVGDDQIAVRRRIARVVVGVDLVVQRVGFDRALWARWRWHWRSRRARPAGRCRTWTATSGLISTRTAGKALPLTLTPPTPGICDRRCEITASAAS